MTKTFTLMLLYILLCTNLFSQNWTATGALDASGSSWYLIGATNVGNNIFVLNATKTVAYSADKGQTWTVTATTKPNGEFSGIVGAKDRLYATMKMNTYDYELNYSMDNGNSWQLDTVGLPKNLTKTGKAAVIMKYMGGDYVLTHDYKLAYSKKLGETKWNSSFIDYLIVDIAATNDKWLAIGATRILQSTDHGANWSVINTTGLPENFQGSLICTNGTRIFVSNAPAAGGQDIYFSDDGGSSWTLTNSAGKFDHANPWIQSMYAVDDYIFASIRPKNFSDAPPFIISSTKQPDFSVGDVSGLPTGKTTSHLPFFFHVGNKLFTMMWDLYSSEPGFSGGVSTSVSTVQNESGSISVYPNPAQNDIQIQSKNIEISGIEIYTLKGEKILNQKSVKNNFIDISKLSSGIYLVNTISKTGRNYQTKLIKK